MNFIGKAFNPATGNARAVCIELDDMIIGLITKGDDAEETIALFKEAVKNIDKNAWSKDKDIWNSINTNSPVLMLCRKSNSIDYFYNNIDYVMGKYPKNPHALESSMTGLFSSLMLIKPELTYPADFLKAEKFNYYYGKDVILLSTAPYKRKKDWELLNKTILDAVTPLCGDNPEQQWDEAEKILLNNMGTDEAYILIVNAEDCHKRIHWNVPIGEPTEHQLKIEWSKNGWELMGKDWNEKTSEIIQAKTGSLLYEEFYGICITEITDNKMTFRKGTEQYTLTPGASLNFFSNDSYEDHEGIEHRDINYKLNITWI